MTAEWNADAAEGWAPSHNPLNNKRESNPLSFNTTTIQSSQRMNCWFVEELTALSLGLPFNQTQSIHVLFH